MDVDLNCNLIFKSKKKKFIKKIYEGKETQNFFNSFQ